MLLKFFKAKEVYGYLNLNVEFNKDITFLHGVNGAGKTTVLKLMQAILAPSFKDIHRIVFKEIELSYLDTKMGKTFRIKVIKDAQIIIKVFVSNKLEHQFNVPLLDNNDLDFISTEEEYFSEYLIDNRDNDVIKFLTTIDAPLFLGLDRRGEKNVHENISFMNKSDRIRNNRRIRMNSRRQRHITGSLGTSLIESEALVQNKYERLRRFEDIQRNKLREELLITSFDYTDVDSKIFARLKKPSYLKKVLDRKEEIEISLSNLSDDNEALLAKAKDFFLKLEELREKSDKKDEERFADIELITNHVQIVRMEKLIATIDEHKSRVDKHFLPVYKFLEVVNRFFSMSNKRIKVNSVGEIKVEKPDGTDDTIEALSSGERQIIIIFIYLIFDESKSKVFIIDEPELSLHLQWQDIFTKSILEVSPETQFILATHSPEIIAGYEHNTVSVNN